MNYQKLEAEYKKLRADYSLLQNMLHEAETQKIEEVGRDGFASQETRSQINDLGDQIADADFAIYVFQQENKDFYADYKEAQAKAHEEATERAIENLWNS